MEGSQWDRIQEIYHSALSIIESKRQLFVDKACGSDPFLAREVTSLLEADQSTVDFLESPLFELGLRIIARNDHSDEVPNAFLADELTGSDD